MIRLLLIGMVLFGISYGEGDSCERKCKGDCHNGQGKLIITCEKKWKEPDEYEKGVTLTINEYRMETLEGLFKLGKLYDGEHLIDGEHSEDSDRIADKDRILHDSWLEHRETKTYKEGKLNGKYYFWSRVGQTAGGSTRGQYVDGKREGDFITDYGKRITSIITYKEDKPILIQDREIDCTAKIQYTTDGKPERLIGTCSNECKIEGQYINGGVEGRFIRSCPKEIEPAYKEHIALFKAGELTEVTIHYRDGREVKQYYYPHDTPITSIISEEEQNSLLLFHLHFLSLYDIAIEEDTKE